jgi:LPXTG-motif cell wall-anchored protein
VRRVHLGIIEGEHMRRTLKALAGICVLAGALFVSGSAVSAQECGGYGPACPPAEQEIVFTYPRTVKAGQSMKIDGEVRDVQATSRAATDEATITMAGQVLGTAAIAADGTFSGTFTVPNVAVGDYTISAASGDLLTEGPITVIADDVDCNDVNGPFSIDPNNDPNNLDGDNDGIACEGVNNTTSSNPLARTGFDATPMVTLGAAVLILGAAAVYGSKRRRVA